MNHVDEISQVSYEMQLRRKFNLVYFLSVQTIYQQSHCTPTLSTNHTCDQSEIDYGTSNAHAETVKDHKRLRLKKTLAEIAASDYKK